MSFLEKYFTPLNKGACVYFLIISAIFFFVLASVFIAEIYFVITRFKSLNFQIVMHGLLIMFNLFIAYFVNRLLYSMCSKSL